MDRFINLICYFSRDYEAIRPKMIMLPYQNQNSLAKAKSGIRITLVGEFYITDISLQAYMYTIQSTES